MKSRCSAAPTQTTHEPGGPCRAGRADPDGAANTTGHRSVTGTDTRSTAEAAGRRGDRPQSLLPTLGRQPKQFGRSFPTEIASLCTYPDIPSLLTRNQ